MNPRLVIFCSLVSAVIGIVIAVGVAELNTRDNYPNKHIRYAFVGGVIGLLVGAGQECLREIKPDEPDEILDNIWKMKHQHRFTPKKKERHSNENSDFSP